MGNVGCVGNLKISALEENMNNLINLLKTKTYITFIEILSL